MTLIYLGCAWLLGIYLGVWLHLPPWALGYVATDHERPRLPLPHQAAAHHCPSAGCGGDQHALGRIVEMP